MVVFLTNVRFATLLYYRDSHMKFRDNTKSGSVVKRAAEKKYFAGGCHARDEYSRGI